MKKRILSILMILCLGISLFACSGNSKSGGSDQTGPSEGEEKIALRVVCTESQEPMVIASEAYFNANGYEFSEVRIVEMNVMVPESVHDGSADIGLGVHLKFMERFNEEKDANVIMAQPYAVAGGMGLFSEKYDNLEDIPDGAQIVLMTDAMNQDRGLRMLEYAGLIKLDNSNNGKDNVFYSIIDISENLHKYEFIEMDQTQTVRSLQDTDAAVCFFSHIVNSGLDVESAIVRDQHPEEYPLGYVLPANSRGSDLEKIASEAMFQDEMKKVIQEDYKGAYVYLDEIEND